MHTNDQREFQRSDKLMNLLKPPVNEMLEDAKHDHFPSCNNKQKKLSFQVGAMDGYLFYDYCDLLGQ